MLVYRRFRFAALAAAATVALTPMPAFVAHAQSARADKPLYKDASQPVDARVEDLLKRMTLEEKVQQMVAIWLQKEKIQTPEGEFDPERCTGCGECLGVCPVGAIQILPGGVRVE